MENPFEIINAKLTAIEEVLREIQSELRNNSTVAPKERRALSINEICAYTGLSRQTIYKKTSASEIPFYKRGKRLFFDSQEIDAWLLSNRHGTTAEAEQKANEYINRKLKK